MFFKNVIISSLILFLGAISIQALVTFLNNFGYSMAQRLLPPYQAGILMMGVVMANLGGPFAIYLRAHKKEPLMGLTIILAVLMGFGCLIFGKLYGTLGIVLLYFFLQTFIAFPCVIFIWHHNRREWHKDDSKEN